MRDRSTTTLSVKVRLNSPPSVAYERFTTDQGRETFLCESSQNDGTAALLQFPNGETTHLVTRASAANSRFAFEYFCDPVHVEFWAADHGTIVSLTTTVAVADAADIRAGWVSVLLALKASVDFGVDLRNHDKAHSWDQGFVDN